MGDLFFVHMGCGASGPPAEAGKMYYFDGLRSRGEPIKLIAAYRGVNLDWKMLSQDEWKDEYKAKFGTVPYFEPADGSAPHGETEDLMKEMATLGDGKSMAADDLQKELAHTANSHPLQTADPLVNLPEAMHEGFGVPPYDKWLEEAKPVISELITKLGDKPFFAGDQPGYGECFIWHNIDNILVLIEAKDSAVEMGTLKAYHSRFAALPGIKQYLASRPKTWGFPGSHLH